MDTGISREQIEAIKAKWHAWTHDPVQLRLMVAAAIFLVSMLAYVWPQVTRLQEARLKLEKAEKRKNLATELRHCVDEAESYTGKMPAVEDVTDWQQYVVDKLEGSGVTLRKLEPRKIQVANEFRFVVLEIEAEGMYEPVVDFVDKLERGDRFIRFDRISIEKRIGNVGLSCVMLGAVRPRG